MVGVGQNGREKSLRRRGRDEKRPPPTQILNRDYSTIYKYDTKLLQGTRSCARR